MDNITIRKLEKKDVDSIANIYSLITQISDNDEFKNMVQEHFKVNKNTSFVAEYEGRVVGYMSCYILFGGFGIKKSAWIAMMGVNPEYMGQGIGEKLSEEVFKLARKHNIKDIYTSVKWDSPDLLSFFKTKGFDRSNFINLRKRL